MGNEKQTGRASVLLEVDDYRQYLAGELSRRTRSNPRYSQRAFSKQLGLSPGEFSEILNGKRSLSLRSVMKISEALGLSQTEIRHLTLLVQMEKAQALGQNTPLKSSKTLLKELPTSQKLSQEFFTIVADWYHFAILNLVETAGFRSDEKWIAKRLGITRLETNFALKRLENVGLLKREKNGRIEVTKEYIQTMEDVPSEAGRRYHQQILQKAISSLDLQNLNEREISGITFPVDLKSMRSIKKDISTFLDEMAAKYSNQKGASEVYQLEMCFFRLTEGANNA